MSSLKSMIEDKHLKENPFSLPENYFAGLENNVHDLIRSENESVNSISNPFLRILNLSKSYVTLAFSFLLVLGLGYGVLRMTNSLQDNFLSSNDDYIAIFEEGYLKSSIVDYMYDEITVEDNFPAIFGEPISLDEELSKQIEDSITEKELLDYLGIE